MFIPYPITENVILDSSTNRVMITNLYADKDLTVRLPQPYRSRVLEVLLLSKHKITLHTNSEVFRFLAAPPALTLTVGGSNKCVGRYLRLETYETFWVLTSTSIPERNIRFEEKQCLDTLTTN